MNKLNILMISPFPVQAGKVTGGVEAVAYSLVQALEAEDEIARVTVLAFGQVRRRREISPFGKKVEIWRESEQSRWSLPTRSFLDLFRAKKAAGAVKPDLVHSQGISGLGDIATRLGIPSVITVHGLTYIEARQASRGNYADRLRIVMLDRIIQKMLNRARVVISTSNYDSRNVAEKIKGKHLLIRNPVSYEFFRAPQFPAQTPRILFAGMMVPRKNIEGLVSAFSVVLKKIPQARLVIAGPPIDKSYCRRVEQRIGDLGLAGAVEMRGHVSNQELIGEMGKCSASVLFSNEETSPTIISQSMAVGKPVIASSVGGIPEIVWDGINGFIVPPQDESMLSERMIELLSSPRLQEQFGKEGRRMANELFEPKTVALQTIRAYRIALANESS